MTDTTAGIAPGTRLPASQPAPGTSLEGGGGRMRSLSRRAAAEGIGTFALVLIGTGAVVVDVGTRGMLGHAAVALAFGAVVTAMVFAVGHLSGAHINPAVTVALSYGGGFPRREVGPYLAAQCIGAALASLVLRAVLGTENGLGATLPAIGIAGSFAVEWLLSFVLMFVIVSVATDERVVPGFAPIPVGLAVGLGVLVGGPLSGGSMNPARSLGPALAGGGWTGHWIYWVAPITAMLAAVHVYDLLRPAGIFVDGPGPSGVEEPVIENERSAAGPPRTGNGPA